MIECDQIYVSGNELYAEQYGLWELKQMLFFWTTPSISLVPRPPLPTSTTP